MVLDHSTNIILSSLHFSLFEMSLTCMGFFLTMNHLATLISNDYTFIYFLNLFYFYWKGRYTERRDREEDLPSEDSFPK